MKQEILENLNSPAELEKLYRSNKIEFGHAFKHIYETHETTPVLTFWNSRLNYNDNRTSLYSKKEFGLTIILIILAGLIANIVNIKGVNQELFLSRNISFIIIPFVSAFFLWKQNAKINVKIILAVFFGISALYINLLPNAADSSSINLVYIHLPIFLWCVLGYAYMNDAYANNEKRIDFLKYNGDLLVMSVILFLAGMLFTVLTIGLFELIGMNIAKFYFEYVGIWGIGAIPILGTYLINTNPQIINKVTPIIAKIFTPLAFINLTIYLAVLISKGKYPHQDRNLLLIYNALLIGVLALIFFSVAEIEKNKKGYFNTALLLGLSVLTIIINGIALSAISYRLFEYGITPNRIAVLGGNILIFVNLLIVTIQLLKAIKTNTTLTEVQNSIAKYLPVYAVWVGLVAFLLPLIFGYK
jgi:hypothetical protein